MLTTSSGAEVPNAITVKPITRSDMPHFFANAEAPSVNASAPTKIMISPEIRNRVDKIIIQI